MSLTRHIFDGELQASIEQDINQPGPPGNRCLFLRIQEKS